MTVKYVGPHPAVEIWPHGYTSAPITINNGDDLPDDLPKDFVESLLEQEDCWAESKPAKTTKKKQEG